MSVLAAGLLAASTAVAEVVHVDRAATGKNDGTSWTDAYRSLQTALVLAPPGSEIWVAAGRYVPGTVRSSSFRLRENMGVYGGFCGGEAERAERDPRGCPTVLSGDVLGDDTGVVVFNGDHSEYANTSDNVYHVVRGARGAVLDGFVIRGGSATSLSRPDESGGGMYNHDASVVVANCIFEQNQAVYFGGAMANVFSDTQIVNCVFLRNRSNVFAGGAIHNYFSSPLIANSLFVGNFAFYLGGALYNEQSSSPLVVHSTFSNNRASARLGDAIYNSSASTSTESSILWNAGGPPPNNLITGVDSRLFFSHSIVQGSGGSGGWRAGFGTDRGGNLDVEPDFADPLGPDGLDGTGDEDLHLLEGSAGVDAGDRGSREVVRDVADLDEDGDRVEPLPLDLGLQPRVQGEGPDMGAYEGPPLPVTPTAPPFATPAAGSAPEKLELWLALALASLLTLCRRRASRPRPSPDACP
jgi:hypothetical protein